jgi:mono/diheme cytochrome c family protein
MRFRHPAAKYSWRHALAWVTCLGVVGCALDFKGLATEWKLSQRTLAIVGEDEEARSALEEQLVRLFGTQAAPAFAAPGDALNRRLPRAELIGTGAARRGSESEAPALAQSATLYAKKCLHCHGNEGGGDGVTATSLAPIPRDFRLGIFKYDNIQAGARPELSDLVQVITNGIEGTAMPSLKMHTEAEIYGLAEYARLLAIRGETEAWIAAEFEPGSALTAESADETYREVLSIWTDEERRRVLAPEPAPVLTEESIRRGYQLFHDSQGAACATCHGASGRGDGTAAFGFTPESPEEKVLLLYDQWGHTIHPRRLDRDIFLHGEQPKQLYERIFLGIDGTPMAGIGETQESGGTARFGPEQLWSLVHYVQALRDPKWQSFARELEENQR